MFKIAGHAVDEQGSQPLRIPAVGGRCEDARSVGTKGEPACVRRTPGRGLPQDLPVIGVPPDRGRDPTGRAPPAGPGRSYPLTRPTEGAPTDDVRIPAAARAVRRSARGGGADRGDGLPPGGDHLRRSPPRHPKTPHWQGGGAWRGRGEDGARLAGRPAARPSRRRHPGRADARRGLAPAGPPASSRPESTLGPSCPRWAG